MSEFHDKCKQVVLFHNNLLKFFKSLKSAIPESKTVLKETVQYYKSLNRHQYISELHTEMSKHMMYVSVNDVGIFSNDYTSDELCLIPKLDFKNLWKLIEQTGDDDFIEATRVSIFKHLQTIFISAELALQQISKFDKGMKKQQDFLMNMIDNLKIDKEVKDKIKMLDEQEENKDDESGFDLSGFSGLLSGGGMEGNMIYSLAQELVNDLNLEDGGEEALTGLFANNGQRMQELIQGIGQKLETKIESGELDRDTLMNEATRMQSQISGLTKSVPGLEKMFKGINPEEIMKQAAEQFADVELMNNNDED